MFLVGWIAYVGGQQMRAARLYKEFSGCRGFGAGRMFLSPRF
jgi:hypothetical protein